MIHQPIAMCLSSIVLSSFTVELSPAAAHFSGYININSTLMVNVNNYHKWHNAERSQFKTEMVLHLSTGVNLSCVECPSNNAVEIEICADIDCRFQQKG